MIVFVVGSNVNAFACAQELLRTFELIPAPTRRWEQTLCHLAHGQSFDAIAEAIKLQSFTLLYGYPWSHPECEEQMRARFPTSIWVNSDNFADLLVSRCFEKDCCYTCRSEVNPGPYVSVERLHELLNRRTGFVPSMPCQCARIELVCRNDLGWACNYARETSNISCFTCVPDSVVDSSRALQLYIDKECATADSLDAHRNISWIVEGREIVPGACEALVYLCRDKFHRTAVHSSLLTDGSIVGHVPWGTTWISEEEYQHAPKAIKQVGATLFVSAKQWTSGHAFRHKCLVAVKEHPLVHSFGMAVGKHLPRKATGMLPFMYSIVVENGQEHGYWTEKLVDAIACRCVVFYWGAPDVFDWLDSGSILSFNTTDELQALLESMSEIDYATRLPSIERNWKRIPAYFSAFNCLALHTDILSSMKGTVTACEAVVR